jgi:hypothetical protein
MSAISGLLLGYGNDIGGVGGLSRTGEIHGVSVVIATVHVSVWLPGPGRAR